MLHAESFHLFTSDNDTVQSELVVSIKVFAYYYTVCWFLYQGS